MSLISIAELQTLIRQRIAQNHTADTASETVPILHATGRVLAQDIVSSVSLPPANMSAMDGYALPHAAPAQSSLKIAGESAAGKPFSGSLNPRKNILRPYILPQFRGHLDLIKLWLRALWINDRLI